MKTKTLLILPALCALCCAGCRSPYYADRGALFGGLTGAGVGALVGNAVADNPESGALVGAAVGAFTGAAVGNSLDEIEARNRAQIEAQLGRQMIGAATMQDVVAMSQNGLGDDVIITYLRSNGIAGTLQPNDLIYLKQQGVSDRVIQAMQQLPPPGVVVGPPPPPPVVIHEYHDPWYWGPHGHYRHHHCHSPGFSWGVSVGN